MTNWFIRTRDFLESIRDKNIERKKARYEQLVQRRIKLEDQATFLKKYRNERSRVKKALTTINDRSNSNNNASTTINVFSDSQPRGFLKNEQ